MSIGEPNEILSNAPVTKAVKIKRNNTEKSGYRMTKNQGSSKKLESDRAIETSISPSLTDRQYFEDDSDEDLSDGFSTSYGNDINETPLPDIEKIEADNLDPGSAFDRFLNSAKKKKKAVRKSGHSRYSDGKIQKGYFDRELEKYQNYEASAYTSSGIPEFLGKDSDVKIPKIIMQTWKNNDVPPKWQSSPESISRYMPDWEYVLMTDENNESFVQKHFPDFWPTFRDFKYNIQRADAIRYMWLYTYGGLYLDLDIELLRPLDKMFCSDNDVYLVCSGNIGGVITNSMMASKPGCSMWLEMLEYMKKPLPWWCIGKHLEVMNSTGPMALNYVVKRQTNCLYAALPQKLVMPCSVCDMDHCNVADAWVKPLPGSSWVAYDTLFYNWFLCHWKKVIIFVLVILIIVFLMLSLRWCGIVTW